MAQAGNTLRQGLAAFFRWWAEGLGDLVPRPVKAALQHPDEPLIVEIDGMTCRLGFRTRENGGLAVQRTCSLADADSSDRSAARAWVVRHRRRARRAILRLPHAHCLVRVISLPLAAEENLRQVLAFEMDRHTPYAASDVYFGFDVLERAEAPNRLFIRLIVSERGAIDDALRHAAALGLRPVLAEMPDTDSGQGVLHTVALDEAEGDAEARRRGFTPALLGALVLMLGTAAVLLPLWQRHMALERIERLTRAAHAEAAKTAQARAQLATERKTAVFLAERRRATPLTIALIDELTRLVPDDAHLLSLQLDKGKLTIRGEAKSATKLIGVLAEARYFRNPAFSAPVQTNPQDGLERFTLEAEVAHAGQQEESK